MDHPMSHSTLPATTTRTKIRRSRTKIRMIHRIPMGEAVEAAEAEEVAGMTHHAETTTEMTRRVMDTPDYLSFAL